MNTWSFYSAATGEFTGATFTGRDSHLEANTPPGCMAMEGAFSREDSVVDLQTGQVVDVQQVQPSIEDVRASKVAELRAAREAAILSGFEWDGSRFDSDMTSQARILGLFVSSQTAEYQPQAWRLEDNSWRTLDAQDAQQVWLSLRSHIAGAFASFASLEAQVQSAETAEDIGAIVWTGN